MSPGNVAREGIPFELFRSTYPGRHVARETYPQRQVARDTPDLSLGNIANVVVPPTNVFKFRRLSLLIMFLISVILTYLIVGDLMTIQLLNFEDKINITR
ncbi:hypothetical protein Tco_1565199 [Tanacetum coccineum]